MIIKAAQQHITAADSLWQCWRSIKDQPRGRAALFCGGTVVLILVALTGVWDCKNRCSAGPVVNDPAIEISPARVDFGSLREGSAASRAVTIANRGLLPVSILDVATSCGCTTTALSDTLVAAGRSLTLVVSMRPEPPARPIEGDVRVAYGVEGSNESHEIVIPVLARLEPEFKIEPVFLTFIGRQRSERELTFVPGADADLRLIAAECDHPAFACQIGPGQHDRRVVVAFDPKKWDGSTARANVFVRTSNAIHPLQVVAIHVTQRGVVQESRVMEPGTGALCFRK
jgi:hypothetical protein